MIENQKQQLIQDIEKEIPDFAKIVQNKDGNTIVLHQDSFAGDYQNKEYSLLGKAIKYAGLYGKEIVFHGTNRETIDTKMEIEA